LETPLQLDPVKRRSARPVHKRPPQLEYQPSSQLFVVYSDGRDTLGTGVPDLLNRSFAVKITRLLRF